MEPSRRLISDPSAPSLASDTASEAVASPSPHGPSLRNRLLPLRLGLWTVIFAVGGLFLGMTLRPLLSTADLQALIAAHLPAADTPFPLVFLRICLSCLPAMLLLSISALTGFSKPIITAVIGLQSVSEGFALGLLGSAWGTEAVSLSLSYGSLLWSIAFGGWILLRVGTRLVLSVSAKRTADLYLRAHPTADGSRFGAMAKHLSVSLACFLILTLGCLGYSALLWVLV